MKTMANQGGMQPSFEPAEAGNVLKSHWRAATARRSQGVYWPHPGEWHQAAATTDAPEVTGASGTLEALHAC